MLTQERALSLGRAFIGAATLGSGVLQLVTGEFVRLVKWPAWLPGGSVFPYLTGVVLVAMGFSILTDRQARAALSLLAVFILVHLFVLYPTQMIANPAVDRPLLRGFM